MGWVQAASGTRSMSLCTAIAPMTRQQSTAAFLFGTLCAGLVSCPCVATPTTLLYSNITVLLT